MISANKLGTYMLPTAMPSAVITVAPYTAGLLNPGNKVCFGSYTPKEHLKRDALPFSTIFHLRPFLFTCSSSWHCFPTKGEKKKFRKGKKG